MKGYLRHTGKQMRVFAMCFIAGSLDGALQDQFNPNSNTDSRLLYIHPNIMSTAYTGHIL